jgi:hypothetical protein
MFKDLLHCRRENVFTQKREQFVEHVAKIKKTLVTYFVKNWFAIHHAWSNVGRRNKYSCANTTTNKAESTWSQVRATQVTRATQHG